LPDGEPDGPLQNVMICQHFVPGPPREILQGGTILRWGPRTDWNFSQNCGFELKIKNNNNEKNQNKMSMGPFRDSCALSWLSGSRTDVPAQPPFHRPCVSLTSPADELKLQSLKIDGCNPSSVIKIVKMKYNRIDIKMWLVLTSFKINIERNSAFLHSRKDGISHTRGRNPRSSIGTRVRIYYFFHPVILTIFKDLQFSTDQKPWWPSWIWHKIIGHNFGRSNTSKFGPIWTLSFLKRGKKVNWWHVMGKVTWRKNRNHTSWQLGSLLLGKILLESPESIWTFILCQESSY
jgi:hypothetical protein